MYFLLLGIVLGMGAAIPIGPVNLEIIRRNLHYGTVYGIAFGLGACAADVTFLFLLSIGALSLLQYPYVLKIFGFCGSLLLIWFAFLTFTSKSRAQSQKLHRPSLTRYSMEGYVMTLLNPITILFWTSISSQISIVGINHSMVTILLAGLGVIIGTVGWALALNTALHFTRHRLNARIMHLLNYIGGVILLGFAITGLAKVLN